MTKEVRKYVELFYTITLNGKIIPYNDDFESLIEAKLKVRSYDLDNWNRYLGYMKRKLEDGFDEWFESIHSIEDIADTKFRDLPDTPYEISANNATIMFSKFKNYLDEFIESAKMYCKPIKADSTIGIYYIIDKSGFFAAAFSFNPDEKSKYKSKVNELCDELKNKINAAMEEFNAGQGPDDIKFDTTWKYSGAGKRSNMVAEGCTFERSIHVDQLNVYRTKSTVSRSELYELFSILPQTRREYGEKL